MDIRQLRYFCYIVESGSLSKASRRLFVAQPALSQQLSKLEREIGKPLLVRSPQGVKPTENGVALYHHARLMLRQIDQALKIARQDSGVARGIVSLGLSGSMSVAFGVALVVRIRERYASVQLNVVEGMSGHLAQLLRLRQLDLAVLFGRDAVPDLSAEPLVEEDLFVVLPVQSTLVPRRRTSLRLEEAAGLPLILPTPAHGLRRRITVELEQRNLSANVVAEIDSLSLLHGCMRAGLGATIEPMGAGLNAGKPNREWRYLPIRDAKLTRRSYIFAIETEMLSPAVPIVAAEIKETVRQLISSGAWPGVRLL